MTSTEEAWQNEPDSASAEPPLADPRGTRVPRTICELWERHWWGLIKKWVSVGNGDPGEIGIDAELQISRLTHF